MRIGSVCSGIEAATVAWEPLGWEFAFYSEIDPFARAVLTHHYPTTKCYGAFTKIDKSAGPIDLLVGGTPCQSFSVAGRRAGLDDPRGNLTLEFLALAGRLKPRWIVWENVPGVLSDDGGRTFGTVLGILGQLGYGFAYRILDAQYFGVPQRRRRVFVVGCLGDWRSAAAVLFESKSLQGYPSPRREAGKGLAPTISARTKGGGGLGTDFDLDGGLITHSLRAEGFDASEDGTGRGIPLVASAYRTSPNCGAWETGDRTDALTTSTDSSAADASELAPTLRSMNFDKRHANAGGQVAVAFQERGRTGGSNIDLQTDLAYSLNAPSGGGRRQEMNVLAASAVRN